MQKSGNFKANIGIWTDVGIDHLDTFSPGLTINIRKL